MVLGMETKIFVWVVWIQVWNLSKMSGYMFGWYGFKYGICLKCMDKMYGYMFGLYGFKYGICLKCMDTCLGGMDSSMEFV